MEWISDPAPVGAWLRARLDDDPAIMTGSVVPGGFAAYARVFHPASVRSLPDRSVPDMDEWMRMPDAEQQRLIALFDDRTATWAETAEAFATTMHPLAQWMHLVRTPPDADWNTRIAPDGREFTSPDEGSLPLTAFAALTEHLIAHTTTPDAGLVALWEGRGGLLGGHGGNGRAFFSFTDEPPREPSWWSSVRANFENPFRKPVWQDGILSREVSEGARLELPGRGHVLFSAPPRAFADPDWILDAPWRDRVGEEHGFPPSAQHPSLLWPEDHAWVMVSEIDYDSTVVAGSVELVAAICADPRLEAMPLPEQADLSWDGDAVNR